MPSGYHATDHDWYKQANAADGPVWVDAYQFPTRARPAIANAAKLIVHDNFLGILMVAIELDRLSAYLADLKVARSGTAFIMDGKGRVIAYPDAVAASMTGDEDHPGPDAHDRHGGAACADRGARSCWALAARTT